MSHAPAAHPQASSVLVVAIIAMIGVAQMSCNTNCQDPKNASSVACVIEGAVVDCTGVSSLSSSIAVVQPIVDQLIASAIQADGSIVWAPIEGQIVDLGLQYGTCVIAEIWNNYVNGVPPGSAAGTRARLSTADLVAEFERIRAKVAPGRKFKIAGGGLL